MIVVYRTITILRTSESRIIPTRLSSLSVENRICDRRSYINGLLLINASGVARTMRIKRRWLLNFGESGNPFCSESVRPIHANPDNHVALTFY